MIRIGEVTDALRYSLDQGHWLDLEEDNRGRGYGRGKEGAAKAKESFLESLAEGRVLGIYKDGLPVGFLEMANRGNWTVACQDFFVAPEVRRQGVGKEALQQFVDSCMKSGAIRVEVDVPQFNRVAQRFLKDSGFWYEGEKRSALWMEGEAHNVSSYRVLKQFWDADKKGVHDGRRTTPTNQRSDELEDGPGSLGDAGDRGGELGHSPPAPGPSGGREAEPNGEGGPPGGNGRGESPGGRAAEADGTEEVPRVDPPGRGDNAEVGTAARVHVRWRGWLDWGRSLLLREHHPGYQS